MLIVLSERRDVILRQAWIHTQIPVCSFCKVAWLLWYRRGNVNGWRIFIRRPQRLWMGKGSVWSMSGLWKYPSVLRLQDLLLDEVLLV